MRSFLWEVLEMPRHNQVKELQLIREDLAQQSKLLASIELRGARLSMCLDELGQR